MAGYGLRYSISTARDVTALVTESTDCVMTREVLLEEYANNLRMLQHRGIYIYI